MALVLIEGEEKLSRILNTGNASANASVTPMNPTPISFEGSAAGLSREAQGSYYMVLLAYLAGFATVYVVHV